MRSLHLSIILAAGLFWAASARASIPGICDDISISLWPAFMTRLCSVLAPEFKPRCKGAPRTITNKEFRAEDVFNLVECNRLTTIEQVLDRLPEDFRSRFTLVYSSGSLHFSSDFNTPRIILYTPSAKLMMGIAGDANISNGLQLEMIQTKEREYKTSGFEMKAILFKEDGVSRPEILANPDCARCHRTPRSPNWTAYPLWPGVYGSGVPGQKEQAGFKSFLAENAKKGRYTRLVGLAETHLSDLDFRNHDLAGSLGFLNEDRITGAINSHPARLKVRYILAGAAKKCANFMAFLSEQLAANITESFEDYSTAVMKDVEERYQEMQDKTKNLAGDSFHYKTGAPFAFQTQGFLGIGYVMKYLLDLDPETFRLSNQGSIYESHHTIGGLGSEFTYDHDLSIADCRTLAARSRTALAGYRLAPRARKQ